MPSKTPAIMLQGTASNAGKSLLCAGICRALRDQGVRVAPFKAQNMSLNSFVTPDGAEIGRAQALQARACGLEPDARMNPVLLKPNSLTGSQVLVLGKPVANMEAREYYAHKQKLFSAVSTAYDTLASEYDVIVLEGAGSPAEVNLKAHDIVNMRMAAYARAEVLLVTDIDRGGAFAALVGTMACLEPDEQAMIRGFILNKFRGDASLLQDALDFTTDRTGKPFYGIMPHLGNHGLPEEDSVSFKEGRCAATDKEPQRVVVACLDFPRISNFTDLDALLLEPDVEIRLVRALRDLEVPPDAVLLPGSKSTMADLAWLRGNGLETRILEFAGRGVEIVGICGGLQMLGQRILDPDCVESERTECPGLGLIALDTVLAGNKTLEQSTLRHLRSGCEVRGYEIHHGESRIADTRATESAFDRAGWQNQEGNVWGTYLHGLFDTDAFRRWWINELRVRKGFEPRAGGVSYSIEPGLDSLARAIREHLDWQGICALLGL